ncbi:MAG: hypothetical protein DRJ13_04530 [Bacteroidetes bacterium]|nr:MAG: hypothetical protein DRJ13_04530 [Bacteroidota bacterium]
MLRMGVRWRPALSVLAARKGIIFLHEAWGNLTPAPDSPPVQINSTMGMASCSKPVAATAVMIFVEQNQLTLHHPLQQYIPEFEGPENGLDFQPGTKMIYCSLGCNLLGELVERISGDSFEKFTRGHIFELLGMQDTTFIHVGLDRERSVLPRPGTTYNWPKEMEGIVSASSTLWSTAYDMGIFLQTFLNTGRYGKYQLLSPAGVDAMTRNQVSGLPREQVDGVQIPPIGLGWFLLSSGQFPNYPRSFSASSYGHSGSSGAFIWADPAYDLIGAFLFTKIKEEFRPLDVFVDSLISSINNN